MKNTQTEKLSKLKSDGYINEDNSVNANVVTKNNMKTGKGSMESGDVYVLETIEGSGTAGELQYYLMYYNANKEKRNLGKVFNVIVETETPEDYFVFEPETGKLSLKKSVGFYVRDEAPQIGLRTLVIPSEYEGQTVTRVGNMNARDVEKIVIPDTVVGIEYGAFAGCSALKNIVIPETVTTIGGCSFMKCTSLERMVIPETVVELGWESFSGCSNLKEIEILGPITKIGHQTFEGCIALQRITLPDTLQSIEQAAFYACRALKQLALPDEITLIDVMAFANCTSLEEIKLPSKLKRIWVSAFSNCSSLKTINLPEGLVEISAYAFNGCTSIQELTIPSSTTIVEIAAFWYWTEEQTIRVPFKQGEQPSGWETLWNQRCNAKIIYQE